MEKQPVDVKKQTKFIYVPGLDLYAAYKVGKLTRYTITILGIGLPLLWFFTSYILPSFWLSVLAVELVVLPIAYVRIKKWSQEWNQQFLDNSVTEETP